MAAKLYITQIEKTFRLVWFWSGDQLEKTPYTWGLEPSSKNFLGHQGLYETTNQNNYILNLNFCDRYVITKDASQSFDQTSLFYMTKITVLIISHLSFIFQIIIFLICKPMIAQNIAHPLSHTHDKTKNIFLYFFTKLKTCHLSYSIYKHDTINIADPCSMQDACQIWTS